MLCNFYVIMKVLSVSPRVFVDIVYLNLSLFIDRNYLWYFLFDGKCVLNQALGL